MKISDYCAIEYLKVERNRVLLDNEHVGVWNGMSARGDEITSVSVLLLDGTQLRSIHPDRVRKIGPLEELASAAE